MRRKITVFGGSGFIGRHLVRRLAAKGDEIRIAVRDVEAAQFLKPSGNIGQVVLWQQGRGSSSLLLGTISPKVELAPGFWFEVAPLLGTNLSPLCCFVLPSPSVCLTGRPFDCLFDCPGAMYLLHGEITHGKTVKVTV